MKHLKFSSLTAKIHRMVFIVLFLYAAYMGYRSWQLLHASFVSTINDQTNSHQSNVPYQEISQWLEQRKSGTDVSGIQDNGPFGL